MAFCQNCGANLNDAKFCAGCGAPAGGAVTTQSPVTQAAPPPVSIPPAPTVASAPQPVMAAPAPVQEAPVQSYQPQPAYQQPPHQGQPNAAPFPGGQAQVAPQGQPPGAYGQSPAQGAVYQQPAGPAPVYQQQPAPQYVQASAPVYQQPAGDQSGYPQVAVSETQMKKGMAILSYFAILVLVPIFAAKDDKFARYHANQGLVLFIIEIILNILSNVAVTILSPINAMAALIVTSAISLLILVAGIFCLIGIINAAKGRMKPVPIFGGITILK